MISLKRFAAILESEFDSCRAGFPPDFFNVRYIPAKRKQGEVLELRIGRRDISINRRGSVIGAGTSFRSGYKIVKTRPPKRVRREMLPRHVGDQGECGGR